MAAFGATMIPAGGALAPTAAGAPVIVRLPGLAPVAAAAAAGAPPGVAPAVVPLAPPPALPAASVP